MVIVCPCVEGGITVVIVLRDDHHGNCVSLC